MYSLNLSIARLDLQLSNLNSSIIINTLPAHKKFTQPGEKLIPASDNWPNKTGSLSLRIKNQPNIATEASGRQLFASEIWELWRNSNADFEFFAPTRIPPVKVVISSDYSQGEIQGDFFSLKSRQVYPLDSLEIRIFSVWLATFHDLILHASGVALDGEGYCFIGTSGAGKSTIAAQLSTRPDATILGEDQIILRYLDDKFWIFGTPWHINPSMCSPLGVPLKKLILIDREYPYGANVVHPVEGVTRILQTAFVPYYMQENMPGILDRLSLLSKSVPIFKLNYRIGNDPWSLI